MGIFSYVYALNNIKVSEEDKKLAEKILIDALATEYGSQHNVENIIAGVIAELEEKESEAEINKFNSFIIEYKDRLVDWYQYSLSRLPLFRYTKTIEDVNKQLHDMLVSLYEDNNEKAEEQAEKVE